MNKIVHQIAQVFKALHWIVGITTLPTDASVKEERSFVLLWLGIILLIVLFFVLLFFSFTLFR